MPSARAPVHGERGCTRPHHLSYQITTVLSRRVELANGAASPPIEIRTVDRVFLSRGGRNVPPCEVNVIRQGESIMGQTRAPLVTLCPRPAQLCGGILAICGCFGERTGARLTILGPRSPSPPSNDHDVTGCFQDEDWDQINDLLSRQKPGDCPSCLESSRTGDVVASGVTGVHRSANRAIRSSFGPVAGRVGLAHQVDPHAARRVESLLLLVARDLVSAKEVTDTCDEVEAALEAQRGRALEDAPGQIARRVPRDNTSVSSEEVAQ